MARPEAGIRNDPGTITISDPKLYSREALINERSQEVSWIQGLIEASTNPITVAFKPDILREVEQISAFSAALGLKFDPAAGANYRRSSETGDIKQEIDVLKLQLELDQLRRDADLFRKALETQTVPSATDIGTSATQGTPTVPQSGALTVSSADQLKAAIDKLLANMATQFGADGRVAIPTTITSSPFDDFRDRSAYRDMLKSARNAASLDELHDNANAALIRLNFQATVLPDEKNRRAMGAVQIKVLPTDGLILSDQFVQAWITHINAQYRSGPSFSNDPTFQALRQRGIIQIYKTGSSGDMALPAMVSDDSRGGDMYNVFIRAKWITPEAEDKTSFGDASGLLSTSSPENLTRLKATFCVGAPGSPEADKVERAALMASDRLTSYEYLRFLNNVQSSLPDGSMVGVEIDLKLDRAGRYMQMLEDKLGADPICLRHIKTFAPTAGGLRWRALQSFERDQTTSKVRIYEVGPREQVQQMSTVARTASSLGLAASVAASVPGSGVAADAAASYSRQAMGRASTLERIPSVVGYSVSGTGVFGWVLGPRAAIDPKGRIEMEQQIKPYDLSVDLSAPGWWPSLTLEITTAWAPSPADLARGELSPKDGSAVRRITVPLSHNSSDYDAFTQYLLKSNGKIVSMKPIIGGPINACTATTLLVTGDNIWRTDRVFVLGQILRGEAISIIPDMKGIFVTVPPITPIAGLTFDSKLYVMTPYGYEAGDVRYVSTPSGEACKEPKAGAASLVPDKTRVSISGLIPDEVKVPAQFQVTVKGANLAKVEAVMLYGQPGTVANTAKDGTSMIVSFSRDQTSGIVAPGVVTLQLLDKDKAEVATRPIRVWPAGGN